MDKPEERVADGMVARAALCTAASSDSCRSLLSRCSRSAFPDPADISFLSFESAESAETPSGGLSPKYVMRSGIIGRLEPPSESRVTSPNSDSPGGAPVEGSPSSAPPSSPDCTAPPFSLAPLFPSPEIPPKEAPARTLPSWALLMLLLPNLRRILRVLNRACSPSSRRGSRWYASCIEQMSSLTMIEARTERLTFIDDFGGDCRLSLAPVELAASESMRALEALISSMRRLAFGKLAMR
mmetsp:Transcript_16617/g.54291  ORF Transcript_16617/g.54291 Transcript_16617/m.54291 type:complete len:240 (-) Transcript_16617:1561-2280(-)